MTQIQQDVRSFVLARIADRIRVAPHDIADATVLVEIGLQSIDAVLICGEIEDHFAAEIDPALMFEFKTFGELVDEVAKRVQA